MILEYFEMGDVFMGKLSLSERDDSVGSRLGIGGTALAAASAEAP